MSFSSGVVAVAWPITWPAACTASSAPAAPTTVQAQREASWKTRAVKTIMQPIPALLNSAPSALATSA